MMNLFNVTAPTLEQWQALERIKAEAYERGREAGFRAGFAAAQQQPQAKIDSAYEQGKKAGTIMECCSKGAVGCPCSKKV